MFKKIVLSLMIRLFACSGLLLFLASFALLACISINNRCEACGPPPGYNPDVTPMVDANGMLYYIAHTTLYAFQDRSGTLLWRYTNPSLDHDTPVVSDGRVYMDMNIYDSSNGDQNGVWVYALGGYTGQVLWRTRISVSVPDFSPAEPRVISGIVYAQSSGATYGSSVFALRASDGKVLWSENPRGTDGESPTFLLATSQFAYITSYASSSGYIVARRSSDGALLWHYSFPSCHAGGGPIINTTIYISTVCASGGETDAFQAQTGKLLWRFTLPDGLITATPTGTIVYVDDAANPSPGIDRFFALDVNTGQLLWRRDIPQANAAANTRIWAADENAVYATMNGVWYALAARDGKQIWQFSSGGRFGIDSDEPFYMQSWLLSPPLVYVPANRQINAFEASTGKLKWDFGLPAGEYWNANIMFYQGVIYLSARIINQQGAQQNPPQLDTYAIQADSGKVLWHAVEAEQVQVMTRYGVYFATVAGQPYHYTYGVLALQSGSGKPIWTYQA